MFPCESWNSYAGWPMPKESFSCITSTRPSRRGLSTKSTGVGTVVSYVSWQPTRTVMFKGVQFIFIFSFSAHP